MNSQVWPREKKGESMLKSFLHFAMLDGTKEQSEYMEMGASNVKIPLDPKICFMKK